MTHRARTKHACDECRRVQKMCGGEHPVCRRCNMNGTQCTYTPHKGADEAHSAAPEADAPIGEGKR